MTRRQAQAIVALAAHDMNVQAAARSLYYHRNALEYHLQQIEDATGKNPKRFYDLCELLPVALQVLQKTTK